MLNNNALIGQKNKSLKLRYAHKQSCMYKVSQKQMGPHIIKKKKKQIMEKSYMVYFEVL